MTGLPGVALELKLEKSPACRQGRTPLRAVAADKAVGIRECGDRRDSGYEGGLNVIVCSEDAIRTVDILRLVSGGDHKHDSLVYGILNGGASC